ncbi:MAG: NAD(P)(+) transhydrogenase (Re/Si-specific) subunit beta [Candidatus Omnitrophica bacterium]|nr:NAD(P)(+) transhydrogenase (Re/Si-specific) subunit beta [Candidatus Omnitrophota bacterium]
MIPSWAVNLVYLVSSCLFIFGLKMLSSVRTARRGNLIAAFGMLFAIVVTLFDRNILSFEWIIAGVILGTLLGALLAFTTKMTAMPQMVALLNGFGGLASALVAWSEFLNLSGPLNWFLLLTIVLGTFVGFITFTGSMVAYGKLEGVIPQQPITYPLQKTGNLILLLVIIGMGFFLFKNPSDHRFFWALAGLSFVLGVLPVLPIGGADMPVVICLLNSYSGIAAAIAGFILMNQMLIIAGSLVGASGIILCQIMCRAMNRSLINVIFGAFGKVEKGTTSKVYEGVKSCDAEETAMILGNAQLVIIVPGYGMAVSRAQHAVRELADLLEARGAKVKYAVHPVAGRMPGHMNVLLAEADVPYDQVFEMDQINPEFEQTDVALVIGANDVVNPSARNEPGSPIYGMPILNVDEARSVIVVKRSLSPGFAGIKNPLFENENTLMLFEDAKAAVEQIIRELKET